MGSDVGREPSYDTHLARLLHERGRVGVDVLQDLLARARSDRAIDPSLSLAISLVQEGILSREEADGYLSELAPATGSGSDIRPTHPAPADELMAWRPGGKIDKYTIGERIGQGGMGTVFLGERDGERFAIKALPLNADEVGIQERFTREYEAQSKLNPHPNVVRVRGAGLAGGARYLVLDLATGGDLQTRLRKGPLPIREVVELGRRLALGLAHVHAHDILHRDLKPGNVLFDDDGTPKLVDFGLARSVAGQGNLTQTGELLGTPSYMAPEQAMAIRGSIGITTDVYGLGAVLFHALTGRPPFVGASTLDILTQAITTPAPKPSSIRATVPPALDAIILKCLAKEPKDRYATADALAEALEGAQLGRARKVPKALVAGAVASILLALGAIGVAATRTDPAPDDPAPTASAPLPTPTGAVADERPREPLDLFAPRVGLKVRSQVQVRSKRWLAFDGIPGRKSNSPLHGEFEGTIGMSGVVTEASPTRAVFKVTVERLRIRNIGGLEGKRLYDSGLQAHRKQPFSAALRKSFTFTMNPRSGAILKTEGTAAVQKAIFDAAPKDTDENTLKIEFFQPSALIDALNRVWCCLPDPRPPKKTMAWTVVPPDPQHIKMLRSYMFLAYMGRGTTPTGTPAQGPVPRKVKVTKRIDRALHVTWRGKKDVRRYRAEAVINGGLVRYAKIREDIAFPGTQVIQGKLRKIEWVFQNEYEATLELNPR